MSAENDNDKPVTQSFLLNVLQKLFGQEVDKPVIKQFQEEEMTAIEPLYCSVGELDGHGDYIPSIEEMRKMVDSINAENDSGKLQSAIDHLQKTQSFKLVRAWVNECECVIGDTIVPQGMPIAKIQFVNKRAFDLRKIGKLLGLSIGARGNVSKTEKGTALTNIDFGFKGGHLSYTTASVGGAASGYNSFFLVKSNHLLPSKELLEIINDLEEELTPLDKSLGVSNADNGKQNTPSSSAETGDDNTLRKGKEKTMSEQDLKAGTSAQDEVIKKLEEQVAALMLANAKEKAKNSIAKYALVEDEAEGLAKALAVLPEDAKADVVKALDSLVAKVAEKEVQLADLAKSKETTSPQDEIVKAAQKELSQEVGHDSEVVIKGSSDAEAKAAAIAKAYEQFAQLEKSKGAK